MSVYDMYSEGGKMRGIVVAKKSIRSKLNHNLNGYFLEIKTGNVSRLFPVLKIDFDYIKTGCEVNVRKAPIEGYAFVDAV